MTNQKSEIAQNWRHVNTQKTTVNYEKTPGKPDYITSQKMNGLLCFSGLCVHKTSGL